MAWAGYSCFTLDFALIKEDLPCSAPVWEEWEHSFVPGAACEHPPARSVCQNKCPWTGQLEQITLLSKIHLAAAICAEASPMGAELSFPIMLIPPVLGCKQSWVS